MPPVRVQVLERVGVVDPDQLLGSMVSVSCGTEEARCFPGRTIAQLRQEFGSRLSIPEGAVAIIDGKPVQRNQDGVTIVGPDTRHVEFVGRSEPKG